MFCEPLLVRGQVLLFHLLRQLVLHLLTANIHDMVTSRVADPHSFHPDPDPSILG
jgi:hypothetical protein